VHPSTTGIVEVDVGPFMAPGPTFAATSGLPPRGDLAGRRQHIPRIRYEP
jgi:hypothetical protein